MIDVKKLEFKPHIKASNVVHVKIPNTGKMYPMTKEQIIASIDNGNDFLLMGSLFTDSSIKAATKPIKESKKQNENESKD